jgi:hypothetical protein
MAMPATSGSSRPARAEGKESPGEVLGASRKWHRLARSDRDILWRNAEAEERIAGLVLTIPAVSVAENHKVEEMANGVVVS